MNPRTAMSMKAFRVPDALWAEAVAIATRRGDNLSEIIRRALEGYVRRYRKEVE